MSKNYNYSAQYRRNTRLVMTAVQNWIPPSLKKAHLAENKKSSPSRPQTQFSRGASASVVDVGLALSSPAGPQFSVFNLPQIFLSLLPSFNFPQFSLPPNINHIYPLTLSITLWKRTNFRSLLRAFNKITTWGPHSTILKFSLLQIYPFWNKDSSVILGLY